MDPIVAHLAALAVVPERLPTTVAAADGALAPCDMAVTAGLVELWLSDLDRRIARGQRAPGTREVYGRAIRPWLAFLSDEARTDAPTPDTVLAYQEAAYQRGLAPATINGLIAAVASLYRCAERHGRYAAIARSIERLAEHRDGPLPCLNHDQVVALQATLAAAVTAAQVALTATPGATPAAREAQRRRLRIARRDAALVGVLYATGIRLVSLARADVADVDVHLREFRHQPKRHRAKDAIAYLSPTAAADLADYLADRRAGGEARPDDPLFAAHDRRSAGGRLTTRSMSRIILTILEQRGHVVRDPDTQLLRHPRRLSAHGLRRSAAKRVYERHGAEVASQLLGHASVATTMRAYARIQRATELRQAADDLG